MQKHEELFDIPTSANPSFINCAMTTKNTNDGTNQWLVDGGSCFTIIPDKSMFSSFKEENDTALAPFAGDKTFKVDGFGSISLLFKSKHGEDLY